jgi:predicted Na+-dependent transporter
VCVLGLAYQFLVQPLLAWGSGVWAVPLPPNLDLGDLLTLLGGMLGLGSLRTAEKFKGVAR